MEDLKVFTIEKQQEIAQKVMDKLSIIDPYSILAGGAPMDWYLGNPANDLDFYFYSPPFRTTGATDRQLRAVFGEVFVNRDEATIREVNSANSGSAYQHMKYLRRIINIEFEGMKVQIMEMREPTYVSVVPAFASSAVQCWWKSSESGVVGTEEFYLDHHSKVVTIINDYKMDNRYVVKLKGKLSSYQITSDPELARGRFLKKKLAELRGVK